MTDNLAEFRAASSRVVEAVRTTHRDSIQRLAFEAMQFHVEESRVRNGYWRAGHTLALGQDQPQTFLYEHPERVGPVGPYPNRASPIPAPELFDLASAAREIPFGESVVFYNEVAHSQIVEELLGDHVYQRSADRIAGRSADEERVIQSELDRLDRR